ncbi:DUF1178 family protein [Pseudogemmobacter sonorensis]|uniref:DUF1178 family protein n=1 Tax=Pseudogemmobacter sonorensis TaxID=2989681 RepID=UPI0036B0F015
MIRYALTCALGHGFESWFASAKAFAGLQAAGHLACPVCGSDKVEKALMAPALRVSRGAGIAAGPAEPGAEPGDAEGGARAEKHKAVQGSKPDLRHPGTDLERALAELRRQVEANSEHVGGNFVAEARRIHAGEAPERAIHGEARLDEARKLVEDGIPVTPLPFPSSRKTN